MVGGHADVLKDVAAQQEAEVVIERVEDEVCHAAAESCVGYCSEVVEVDLQAHMLRMSVRHAPPVARL